MTVRDWSDRLPGRLDELLSQECSVDWELVVSVDGRSPDTITALQHLAAERPSLRVVVVNAPGIPAGRNAAATASHGRFIVTCDADDSGTPGWLESMFESLQSADLVSGRSVNTNDQLGTAPYGYLPYGLTANLGFSRKLYDEIGGFDESMRFGDDVDFTWRAQRAGHTLAPSRATIVKQRRATGSARFNQHFLYGTTDVLLYRSHAAHGMPRHLGLSAKSYGWLVLNVWRLARSSDRRVWLGVAGHRAGRLRASLKERVFYP